jgi:hypothetical protein
VIVIRRQVQSRGRVGFDIPLLESRQRQQLEIQFGLIAEKAGKEIIDDPEPAQQYRVRFVRDDGTEGDRLGGFSVPAEIADAVATALVAQGYSVE